jgi:hypothetical protein
MGLVTSGLGQDVAVGPQWDCTDLCHVLNSSAQQIIAEI